MDEFEKVSIGTMESALQHLQETNKRLAMITALALIVAGVMFCSLMYFLTNYEIVTQDVTIDSCEEEKYSNAMGRYSREGAYGMEHSYMDGGYSRSNDNLKGQLYKMMEMSSDASTRDKLRRFIDSI